MIVNKGACILSLVFYFTRIGKRLLEEIDHEKQ